MPLERTNHDESQRGPTGRSRLRYRLLGWFLLFSLVPLFVTNTVGYWRTKSILRDQAELSLATLAQVQAQHIQAQLERHLLTITAITSGNEFLLAGVLQATGRDAGEMGHVASPAAMKDLLRPKLRELRAFKALFLYTASGRVLAAVGDTTALSTRADWDARYPMLSAEAHTDDGALSPHFHLAAPIRDHHGRVVAFLGGTVDVMHGNEFLEIPAHLADDVESFIVDSLGRPIFVSHRHGSVDFRRPLSSAALRPGAHVVEQYTAGDGTIVLGTVRAIPGYPWRYLAELPIEAAYADLRSLAVVAGVLESLFLAILVVVAWLAARGVVRPLQALQAASHQVARGDLTARVPDDDPGEVGDVGRAFNEMTAALADSEARVQAMHDQEIKRAAQLATVGELASGIAHEIKNPVLSVAHGLDLVQKRIGDRDPWLGSITGEMRRSVVRIQNAIQELLTFARPSTPTFQIVSANGVLQRAVRLVQPAASRAGVHLEVVNDPLQPRLQADEDMVLQALVNLMMNAVEASGAGHVVTVSVRWVADDVVFEVADTGRGIPTTDLETVFRPFYTTRHTGTGLGLPISRGVAEKHGGTLSLTSEVGRGTTAVMRLPLEPTSVTPAPAREAQLV